MPGTDIRPNLASPNTGVVITGGASGLGFASARALAAVGPRCGLAAGGCHER